MYDPEGVSIRHTGLNPNDVKDVPSIERFWSALAERSGDGAFTSGGAGRSGATCQSHTLVVLRRVHPTKIGVFNAMRPDTPEVREAKAVSPLRSATALQILPEEPTAQ
jgi:hypothetical protein